MSRELTTEQLEEMEAQKHLEMKMWTPEKFTKLVLEYSKYYDLDIIDAVLQFCEEHGIDIEIASTDLMSDKLKELIHEDGREKNLLYKTKNNELRFE